MRMNTHAGPAGVCAHDNMSDLWGFPSPVVHQSSQSSPLPPFSSLSSLRNHGTPPPSKVTPPDAGLQSQMSSYQVPQSQVTSPHHSQPQVTSPQNPQPQVTSPQYHQPQVTSPQYHQPQVTSPQYPQPQVTSPQYPQPQVTSPQYPQPQVTSPHYSQPQVTSPHYSQPQMTSPHYPQPQVTSPQYPQSQVTSPQYPQPQVTSPHYPNPQVSSPHYPNPQVSSPHYPNPQVTSSHYPHPQVTSPHYPHPQVTSPHLAPQMQVSSSQPFYHLSSAQVNSPGHLPPAQVNSPLLPHTQLTSPHLMTSTQNLLVNQNLNPESEVQIWNNYEPGAELSSLLSSDSLSYQNQSAPHLDLHLQNLNQFSTCEISHSEKLDSADRLYNNHTLDVAGMFEDSDVSRQTAGVLVSTVSQLQCSPLGSTVANWRSAELSSSSTQDFPRNQFFFGSYQDGSAPQPFSSPTTPGLSPHYPQTPTVSSPGPLMGFHTPTTQQPSIDLTFSCGAKESNSFCVVSDTCQRRQPDRHLYRRRTKQDKDLAGLQRAVNSSETVFSSQDVCRTGASVSLPPGSTCKEEGGGERGGARDHGGPEVKQIRCDSSSESPDLRLLCTVCKRDFRSLPALNGHMRSHSGFRSPTWKKKETSSPSQRPVSMVMPVSVPVRTRGVASACRSGQKRCSIVYRSLMHLQVEEEGGKYCPPPMLCPQRPGQGLYWSLTIKGQQRVKTAKLQAGPYEPVAMATACPPAGTLTSGALKPKINLGQSFQAEIPPLRSRNGACLDSHNAALLWTPWDELEHPANHQRVEALLLMSRSSAVPAGGVSPEYTLHVLSESSGDFLLALEKLLSSFNSNQTGVRWSPAEKKQLLKSLQLHHKDFSSIQRAVRTKSVSECVEFYYLWKKKLSLSRKTQTDLTVTLPDANGQRPSKSPHGP